MQSERDSSPLILPGEGIVLDWSEEAYDKFFGNETLDEENSRGSLLWGNYHLETIVSDDVKKARAARRARSRKTMTVYDCIDEFMKVEVLSSGNAWRCPHCKEFRQALKKVGLWTAPDIIPIHLKRFSATSFKSKKITDYIDFPIEGLDLTPYVEAPEEGKSYIYDLFAVDCHNGSLTFGHYTAYAKNSTDQQWHDFNGMASLFIFVYIMLTDLNRCFSLWTLTCRDCEDGPRISIVLPPSLRPSTGRQIA